MAFFSISNIGIKGISAAVPEHQASNFDLQDYEQQELDKLIATIGIENRRISAAGQCASDLCISAANKLIEDLKWDKTEIEVLFFVTQTPDYQLPGTSLHIQNRIGLSKSCACFDINQGCAGYVYGLSLISAFMSSSGLKKGLLLVGDTITKLVSPFDKSLVPVFSDAGTATALEFSSVATKMNFNLSSEGQDFEAIIVPEGGARVPLNDESFNYKMYDNAIQRKGFHLAMKGLDVFNFSLKKVVPNVEELFAKSQRAITDIDYFVFHQANKLILESLSKKLNLDMEKVPSSLKKYGNTSGATIPLTIVSELKNKNKITDSRLLLSGFGVGLSIASAIVEFSDVVCSDIIEV